tara:strand:+ start:1244 stop:2434 length:1191 start_codon:yes stop_codon:yes gene_type:complete
MALPTTTGALANLGKTDFEQAMKLAKVISRPEAPPDLPLLALQYFSKMGEEASRPGATAFGSATSALSAPAKYLEKHALKEKQRKQQEPLIGLQIASLMKPKEGTPKTVKTGMATDDAGEPILGPDGKPMFEWTVYRPDGTVLKTFTGPSSASTSIDLGGDKSYKQRVGTVLADDIAEQIGNARQAGETLQSLKDMATLLERIGETGPVSEFFEPFRRIGGELGINVDKADLRDRDVFRSKANEIVLASVKKMTGAISEKELNFLESIAPQLSRTTDGNRLLIQMMTFAAERQSAFGDFAREYRDAKGEAWYDSIESSQNLQREWRKTPEFNTQFRDYIRNKASEEFEQIKRDPEFIAKYNRLDPAGRQALLRQRGAELDTKYQVRALDKWYLKDE